jgi:hypothetical protein
MRRVVTFFDQQPLAAELVLLLVATVCVWLLLRSAPSVSRKVTRAWGRLAARRGASVVFVGLLSFALQAFATRWAGVPAPTVHDEFCYLLAGDTFARGRLTNPTHPLWEHFESFHLIQQPTYAAKYPPVQGWFLAAGQLLAEPIVGVWLSMALASAAVCWMLQQWLPPRWALLGGLLFVLQPRIFWDWGQTYMGGAGAVVGEALVFGAIRALHTRPRSSLAVVLGLGLAILANSRPFEGLILSLPVAALLLRARVPLLASKQWHTMLPLAITLVLAALATGYYHWRVTGDPLRMPYQVHEDTYSLTPIFLWQEARPEPQLEYRHQAFRDFHAGWSLQNYQARRSFGGVAAESWSRLKGGWQFFLGPTLTVSLLALPWVLKSGWMRFALVSCLFLVVGLAVGVWFAPHYAAPMTGLLLLFVVQGLRLMSISCGSMGKALVGGVLITVAVLLVVAFHSHRPRHGYAWPRHRAELLEQFRQDGLRHLVIVRYSPAHSPHCEWVYNEAGIDDAKVVWARDMGAEKNTRLRDYFPDRRVWLLDVDDDTKPPTLTDASAKRR